MVSYTGIPNKKRAVLVDTNGDMYPLSKGVSGNDRVLVASSGTIGGAGDVTVTGTEFKPTSVVLACYNDSSAGTAPIAVVSELGSATFKGDSSTDFYYIVIN